MLRTTIVNSQIHNGEVSLAVSESGQGQKLIFFNGLGATQSFWNKAIAALSGQYKVVTFDFRGHGKSSTATDYSFNGFLSDAEAVMEAQGGDRPLLVGHSLGADLAVWYAATHPGQVAGIFLIDGAIPVNLIDNPEEIRQQFNAPMIRLIGALMGVLKSFGVLYHLPTDDLATLNIEVNELRGEELLEVYGKLDCPVELVAALHNAGTTGARAEKMNPLWQAAAKQLVSRYPAIALHWLDSTHLIPLTKPAETAKMLQEFAQGVKSNTIAPIHENA